MKRSEWAKEVAKLQARWPRQPISPESAAIWFEDLAEFPAEQVNAAVTALYRDGREWAPNGAQIRIKLLELHTDVQDWGEAYETTMTAIRDHGGFYAGLDWLRKESPLAAEAAERYGWESLCRDGDTSDGTRRAQYREIFQGVAKRAERDRRYDGIPDAGLKVLERANQGPVRFGDMVQLETPAELEEGTA